MIKSLQFSNFKSQFSFKSQSVNESNSLKIYSLKIDCKLQNCKLKITKGTSG